MVHPLSPDHVIFHDIFNACNDFYRAGIRFCHGKSWLKKIGPFSPKGAKGMSAGQTLKQNLYLHAVKLLSLRPHSSLELSQKLARVAARKTSSSWKRYNRPDVPEVSTDSAGLPPKEIANEVIHDLEHMKVLDDTAFAQWFCKQRQGECEPSS
jgi:RecX family